MKKLLLLLLCVSVIGSSSIVAQGYNTLSFGASGVQHEDTLYFGDSIHVSFWLVNQGTTPIYDFVSIISNTYDINGNQIGWGTLSASGNFYNTDSSLTVGDSIFINITASVSLFSYVLGDNTIEIWPALPGLGNVIDTSFTPIHILTSNIGGPIVYIPDANFKALLISPFGGVNTNGDSEIQVSEAAAYSNNINVGMSNISDLTGIEAFINLTEFSCYGNQLTNIDLTQNTALTYLNCEDNQLTSLDLSHNSALNILYCDNNQLTTLNLNGAVSLGAVRANYNQLTSLDLSTNVNLEVLEVTGNKLTLLDVSQNPVLNRLDCEGQNWPNSQLTSLDLSQNSNLQWVECSNNQLTSLNLNGTVSLETLYCSYNQLTSLDLSTNTILGTLFCPHNQITSLDLTQNLNTIGLSIACWDNALINLDIRNGLNTSMWNLHCYNNPNLTCINVDDSVFMYNWMTNSPNPPQVQIDPQHYFSNNCPTSTMLLCDSVVITYSYMDSSTTPDLIYFDVQVSGFGPNVGYPGFVLLDQLGDTIAYENFNTAGNVYTLMPNAIETRFLDVIQNISLPFNGFLHLVDGWFAGNPNTACIYPFYISGMTSITQQTINKQLLKTIDILGRKSIKRKNNFLFYIYNDGTVEKRIIIE